MKKYPIISQNYFDAKIILGGLTIIPEPHISEAGILVDEVDYDNSCSKIGFSNWTPKSTCNAQTI